MDPVTIKVIATVAIDKRTWKIVGTILAGVVMFFVLVFGTFFNIIKSSPKTASNLSEEVLGYAETIYTYADQYGIGQFVAVIQAVMMQESGGKGNDPMQSSACPYNTEYPNGIEDAEYSIECGIRYLADCIRAAGCSDPTDMDKLSLGCQGYNYGGGYITWALRHYGGYTAENAKEFSEKKKEELGWEVYGDPDYVPHVMQYYIQASQVIVTPGEYGSPFPQLDWTIYVTSGWGGRDDPFGTGGIEKHGGIDIAPPFGTPIYTTHDGTVSYAGEHASYGRYILLDKGDGVSTVYAHCSQLLVQDGDQVVKGQMIAQVGSTGDSTGPHLHYEVRVGGTRVNPIDYLPNKEIQGAA